MRAIPTRSDRRRLPAIVMVAAIGGLCAAAPVAPAMAQSKATLPVGRSASLVKVAAFSDRQVTGIAVSKDGRIFVNFPRWAQDVPVSVGEIGKDGKVTPYPNGEWNAWRNAQELSPGDHFVCVQSVVIDAQGFLWVVDPAAPGLEKVVKGGAKLVKIDLAKNAVVQTILLGESVAPPSSYMNDIRFAPDGSTAYLTDSGKGALVVVDLGAGQARRVLDGHPSTQVEPEVKVRTDGKPLMRPDGRGPKFAADGIALSLDGRYLYWQALTGHTLYRIETAALRDPNAGDLAGKVEKVATTGVADGLWMDASGRLIVTAPEEDALKVLDSDGKMSVLVQDKRLRWPDTMSQGGDGTLYVTSSHIMDMPWYKPSNKATPSEVWKITVK